MPSTSGPISVRARDLIETSRSLSLAPPLGSSPSLVKMTLTRTRTQHRFHAWLTPENVRASELTHAHIRTRTFWSRVVPDSSCRTLARMAVGRGRGCQHVYTQFTFHSSVDRLELSLSGVMIVWACFGIVASERPS